MAIATVLNRTLVLPPLWGAVDKGPTEYGWGLDHGVWPGSQNRDLPRVFPADYFLDLGRYVQISPSYYTNAQCCSMPKQLASTFLRVA